MPGVRLERVTKIWPSGVTAVDACSLTIEGASLTLLTGPSGSGKTTLLRLVAGLDRPDTGRILLGDRVVNDLAPPQRDVTMAMQGAPLYPHLRAGACMGLGLRARGVARAETRRRVRAIAGRLGIEDLLRRRVHELSGGQRQRVALGRALVRDAAVCLLDEPLASLDPDARDGAMAAIIAHHDRTGATTIVVAHESLDLPGAGLLRLERGRIVDAPGTGTRPGSGTPMDVLA